MWFCLEGENPKEDDKDDWDEEHWDQSDPYYVEADLEEIGLEKQFYWRVPKALELFRILQRVLFS